MGDAVAARRSLGVVHAGEPLTRLGWVGGFRPSCRPTAMHGDAAAWSISEARVRRPLCPLSPAHRVPNRSM